MKLHQLPIFIKHHYLSTLEQIKDHYQYFATMPHAFGLTIRYSVKANPNRTIIALFDKLGAKFDVSSVWEARRAILAGVEPSKILMTAQEMSSGWEDLCRYGVEFDAGSLTQLDHYGSVFPNSAISVRINPGFGSGLMKRLTTGGPHSSFGIWHEDLSQVKKLIQKHGLVLKRIHIHIGSGHEGTVLGKTVLVALELCEQFPDVSILNFGGGYKIAALSSDLSPDHQAMAGRIAIELKKFAHKTSRKLHVEFEPGTYLMAMSGSIIAQAIDVTKTGENGFNFIKLNTGLTELIRPSHYGVLHPLVTVHADGTLPQKHFDAIVVGHCCLPGDNFSPKLGNIEDFEPTLLGKIKEGDYLIIERAGAYSASMSLKNFNSYPEALELLRLRLGQYTVIRARQSIEQIVQNEHIIDMENILGAHFDR